MASAMRCQSHTNRIKSLRQERSGIIDGGQVEVIVGAAMAIFLGAILEAFLNSFLQFGFAFASDNLGRKHDRIEESADHDFEVPETDSEAIDEPSP
jgi:hypothetical protein